MSMASVITLKKVEMADFNIASLYQVLYAPYIKPGFGENIGVDFILVYQISDKAAQVISLALPAILLEEREYSAREDIAGGSNQADIASAGNYNIH